MIMRRVLFALLLSAPLAQVASAQGQYEGAASRALCRGSIEDCRREAEGRRSAQPAANLNGAYQYNTSRYGLTAPPVVTPSTPNYAPRPAYASPSAGYAAPTYAGQGGYAAATQPGSAPSNTELAQRIQALDSQMNDIKAMLARMEAQMTQ